MRVKCPKCGYPQYCGCNTCIKDGEDFKRWIPNTTSIPSWSCGYTMSYDYWLNEELKQMLDNKTSYNTDFNKTL